MTHFLCWLSIKLQQLTNGKKTGKMSLMNLDPRLFHQALTTRWLIILAVLTGFIGGVAAVFQARQLSRIIARVFLEGQGLADVTPLLWVFLLILVCRSAVGYISEAAAAAGAMKVKENLRCMLTRHILALGPAYTQGERSGDLLNIASQGIEALDAYFSQYLPQLALAGMLPLAFLVIILPSDPLTGFVLLFTGPLIPLFMFLIGHNTKTLTQRQWGALGQMSAYFLDTLQGLATLKALGRSIEQADRIAQVSERYRQTTLSVMRLTFLSSFVLELLGTMGTAIIAVQIGLRLLYGRIDFELAFFILLLAPDFYAPLRALGLQFHASMAGVTAARQIFSILELPVPHIQKEVDLQPVPSLRLPFEIVFEDVSITYPDREQPALAGISFTIHSGETVALVGHTGAGKSTLAHLLLRFMQPDSGKILVNGVSLDRTPIDGWREQIAWVPQQPMIFHGTIADNMRIAKPAASAQDLRCAAENAHLMDFIDSLPLGFDTPVAESGARLSSGQAQRLALARALLRDAPFLILDEPTAHLDVEQESLLRETTQRLCQNRTVLIIAHRLPSVLQADQVIVLEGGRVVESGSPQSLLDQRGAFSRITAAYTGLGHEYE